MKDVIRRLVSPTVMLGIALSATEAEEVKVPVDISTTQITSGPTNVLEGPTGVSRELAEEENVTSVKPALSSMESYAAWKREIKEEHALSFGLQAIMLYQKARETKVETDDDGASGIYRFNGTWTAFNDDGHIGRLAWRVENRSAFGSFQSPSDLSDAIGIKAVNSGFAYSDTFDTDLSVLNWSQGVEGKYGFAVGRLAFDVYLDAFLFQTFSRAFINRAFVYNATLPTTGIGALGAAAKGFVTENILIGAQIYDANAVSGHFDINTFNQHEWLKALEIAWTPSQSQYKVDRIQFTYWEKDAREEEGVEKGSGWAVSASTQYNENLIPFIRFGHSDGGAAVAAKSAAAVGFEYTVKETHAWSLGAAWSEPTRLADGSEPRDEYVFETSYKVQMTPHISLTPDVQYLLKPANNLDVKSDWVAGLRCIVTL